MAQLVLENAPERCDRRRCNPGKVGSNVSSVLALQARRPVIEAAFQAQALETHRLVVLNIKVMKVSCVEPAIVRGSLCMLAAGDVRLQRDVARFEDADVVRHVVGTTLLESEEMTSMND